jgi:hypothetical protein
VLSPVCSVEEEEWKPNEINMTKNKIKANVMKERAKEWNENREQGKTNKSADRQEYRNVLIKWIPVFPTFGYPTLLFIRHGHAICNNHLKFVSRACTNRISTVAFEFLLLLGRGYQPIQG